MNSPEIEELLGKIKKGVKVISLSGLTSIPAKSFVLSKIQAESGKSLAIITDTNRELDIWENDLEFWMNQNGGAGQADILSLPSFENDIYSSISPHAETLEKRALTLWRLIDKQPKFLIASAKSLITRIISPDEMRQLGAGIKRDEEIPPEILSAKLIACGYVMEEPLKNIGEFSIRGGIIDIWPPNAEMPVRIEFFGDAIDSIREFDPETQLSIRQLKEIEIAPMREFSAATQDFKDWAFFARERFSGERFARNLKDRTQFADEGESFPGWEFMISLVKPRNAGIFDYLKDMILIIDDPIAIEQSLEGFYGILADRFAQICDHDDIGLAPDEFFINGKKLREKISGLQRIELRALGKSASVIDEEFSI